MTPKKIFISHRGSEQAAADEVVAILKDLGHNPVDMSQWAVGEDFFDHMDDALESCDHMIALWSPAYFESKMCALELRVAAHLAEDRQGFLAPYKIKECEAPVIYSTKIHGDFTDGADRAALEQRFNDDAVPPAPDAPAPATSTPAKTTTFTHNIPREHSRLFHGRGPDLARLHTLLTQSNRAAIGAVQGMGGVGKTTLAIHYARHQATQPVRWWVNAETEQGLTRSLAALARHIGQAVEKTRDADAARAALTWLSTQPDPALIIYDNAADPGLLRHWLPGEDTAAQITTLITTKLVDFDGFDELPLETWDNATAADYLMTRAKDDHAATAQELARALSGLPLACEQAAAYCRQAGLSLADYLEIFNASPGDAMGRQDGAGAYPTSVARTIELAIEQAAADCPAARTMLMLMAQLNPAPLPRAVFGHENAPEGLRTKAEAADAAHALTRWALIWPDMAHDEIRDIKTPCTSAHRLIHKLLNGGENADILPKAVTALAHAFPDDASNNPESWPLAGALTPHVRTDWPWERWEEEAATIAASALKSADDFVFGCRADYETSILFIEEALRIERATVGEQHERYAVSLNNLATLLRAMGRYEEAEPLFRQALEIDEATIGRQHPEYATRLNNLAGLLRDMGRYEEAEPLLRQALEIDEATIGRQHPDYATHLNNLASLLCNMDRYEEAEPLYRQALEIGETTIGRQHPSYAIHLNNLASLLHDMGRYEEAERLYRQALKIGEATIGRQHPNYAIRANNLANLLRDMGQYEGAAPLYRQSVAIFRAAIGDDHSRTKKVANNFLSFLRAQNGDPAEIAAMQALVG